MLDTRDFNPDDYLTVFPQKKAKKWFNADSVFIFDVSPVKQEIVLNGMSYKHCTKMYVSCRDRAFIQFVLFYTDDVEKKKLKYLSQLQKNIWYHDGEWNFDFYWWNNWIGAGFISDVKSESAIL